MRLGTRGSALALAQAAPVASALNAEVVVIKTSGDVGDSGAHGTLSGNSARTMEARSQGPSDKERWVDTIEQALLDGEIDVAVHSAKDVPGELSDGLALVATAGRANPSDALVGARSIDDLPTAARVGTSSPRRKAQLLAVRPDLDVVTMAGNVDTRLAKLAAGEADAIVLAAAGLLRLGKEREIGAILDPTTFIPAPGQGTLVLEARAGFRCDAFGDTQALKVLEVEREVARLLGADCNSAVGILCNGTTISAWVGKSDGSEWIRDEVVGLNPEELAQRLLSSGARPLLS